MQFAYEAMSDAGQTVQGTLEAPDRRAAVALLATRGQYVTSLSAAAAATSLATHTVVTPQPRPTAAFSLRRRITNKDLLAFTAQLSTALRSGLPLMNCLAIIRQQGAKPAMVQLLTELESSVSSGMALSDAMAQHPKTFSPLYCAMVRVGEAGGILEHTTAQLTRLLGRDEQIRTQIRNASAYPLFVLSIGLLSVVVIVTWLMPQIVGTIYGTTAALPWPTRMLLALSATARGPIGIATMAALLIAAILGRMALRRPAARRTWDRTKLKLPVLGPVLRSIAVGRFARTFGALTQGGVTVMEALTVVRGTLGNEVLAGEIDNVIDQVRAGTPLAQPLARSGAFPPLLVQIVSLGEQTGKLDELLLTAADTFDSEADAAVTRFMAILPALLVLLLAIIIGFIIVATLLPIVGAELGTGTL